MTRSPNGTAVGLAWSTTLHRIASRVDLRHGELSSVDDRHGRRRVHLAVRRGIRRHAVVETRYHFGGFAAMKWWIRTTPLAARPTST